MHAPSISDPLHACTRKAHPKPTYDSNPANPSPSDPNRQLISAHPFPPVVQVKPFWSTNAIFCASIFNLVVQTGARKFLVISFEQTVMYGDFKVQNLQEIMSSAVLTLLLVNWGTFLTSPKTVVFAPVKMRRYEKGRR